MSRKSGTENTFQERFKDRMENMGKDGVVGIMKNTDNPINKAEFDKMKDWNNLYNESSGIKSNFKVDESKISSQHSLIGNSAQMIINNKAVSKNGLLNKNNMNYMNTNSMMYNQSNPQNQYNQNNKMNNMMNLNNQLNHNNMNNMNNPYYNNLYMQMMDNRYTNMPMNYNMNPQQSNNQTPVNNFNRNLMNLNMPMNNYNNHYNAQYNYGNLGNINNNNNFYQNQPIKLMPNNYNNNNNINTINNTPKNITTDASMTKRQKDKQTIQRSMSSKNRSNNPDTTSDSYLNSNTSKNYLEPPNTNPDSFSKRRGNSSNYEDGSYKPYTLKDYKEITTAKIVLGSLGPNLGTKEWEERQQKLKKIQEYASGIKNTSRIMLRIKKDTPQDIEEKQKREKIENSTRFKSLEYAKLIKKKPRTTDDNEANYKELGIIHNNGTGELNNYSNNFNNQNNNNNNNFSSRNNRDRRDRGENNFNNFIQGNNVNNSNNLRYNNSSIHINSSNYNYNINQHKNLNYKQINNYNSNNENNENNENNFNILDSLENNELVKLQKQRENYNLKINEIKESLLNK